MIGRHEALIRRLTEIADECAEEARMADMPAIARPVIVGTAMAKVYRTVEHQIRELLLADHVGAEIPGSRDADDARHLGVVREPGKARPETVDLVGALRKSVDAARDRRRRGVGEFDHGEQ